MKVNRVSEHIWEIPVTEKEGMRVPARIYASEKLFREMEEGVFEQATNVACLPGIQKYSYCMPDGHVGYGFPIGGVAAFDLEEGIISPGGIGFDINCGMRLIRTDLRVDEVKPKIRELVDFLFQTVPTGVGGRGIVRLKPPEFREVMSRGVDWCIEQGYGWQEDAERVEEEGHIEGADPGCVSDRAVKRGLSQLGTLGSGNHYLEIQEVKPENIFDRELAEKLGIFPGQITVMIHCGSRGFGHQIGTDYLKIFDTAMQKYGLKVKDRELACAPFQSEEGQSYFKAMKCAANMAFANRQLIVHRVREAFKKFFKKEPEDMGMETVYDVAHNIAKIEEHQVNGKTRTLLVHRKGSTRCFGPSRKELPQRFRETGQPVIVGGSMETGSYLLVGTDKALTETFGSTMHGSGRTMSRSKAKKKIRGTELQQTMERHGIIVKAASMSGLAEEAGFAYKDIQDVVDTVDRVGISRRVARFTPLGNIKG